MGKWLTAAQVVRAAMDTAGAALTDEIALAAAAIYPMWATDKNYTIGDRIQHNAILYKCVQSHTSQADWTPDVTPALWVRVSIEEWPEFVKPTGAHDAYAKGDKVTFKGKHYISLIDANVYSPEEYPQGWEEVTGA